MILDIVYRMTRFGIVSVHGFIIRLQWLCGHCEGEGGDGVLLGVYIYCFLTLQLLFSRFVSFRVSFITFTVFFRLPTPAYIYISIYLLQVYIE